MIETTIVRHFAPADLPALVAFWNEAFKDRRNFRPMTAAAFSARVLAHPAFDAQGLLLAWRSRGNEATLVGMAHAWRPAPQAGLAAGWGEGHALALLYVRPDARGQGVGSRLAQAAENWLYYCPVLVGWPGTPAYGTVEGYHAPLFGSSEHMGVSAQDATLTRFLSGRGYRVVGAGDVSMELDLTAAHVRWAEAPPAPPARARNNLHLVAFDSAQPFAGREPDGRVHFAYMGSNGGNPYSALALLTDDDTLVGHAVWYPLAGGRAAFTDFRIAPALRNQGLGGYLLDSVLHRLVTVPSAPGGDASGYAAPYTSVELLTHLLRNAPAVHLYEARGFVPVAAWVQMEKT